jgi:hypothetical protein
MKQCLINSTTMCGMFRNDKLNKRAQNWNTILVLLAINNGLQVKQGTQTVTVFILYYFGK